MNKSQSGISVIAGVNRPLAALNFFMADLQAGIGPFLGVFLLVRGWQSGIIGTVMTIGGLAGMFMTAPAGALIDATSRKRMCVVISAIFTSIASAAILFSQNFWLVSISQVATAIAGAILGPAVIGITMGIVRQKGFHRQNGWNQGFNHAGNVVGALLSGYLGMRFGMPAIFIFSALFGVFSVIAVLLIPPKTIDDRAARGLKEDAGGKENKAGSIGVLFKSKALLILAISLAFFHLGNGAMLPLYGIAAATKNQGDPTMFVAMTIVIAQFTMVFCTIVATRLSEKKYWIVLLISFIALPVRGFIAAHLISQSGIYPVQILDGVGAGLQSVAVPGLVAVILNGTGRINVGQGSVMTMQSIGAALSPALGGWIAQMIGYNAAFLILGSFALVSILLWVLFSSFIKSLIKTGRKEAM